MAPKSAMKVAMKAVTQSAMKKASPKSVMKTAMKVKASSSSKDRTQDLPAAEKKRITKLALKNLGNFSLADKVKKAIDDNEGDPEAAAVDLKGSLTKLEHSKIWGQHRTFLNNNPEEAAKEKEADTLDTKKDKGLACALWYIKAKGSKFLNLTHKVGGQIAVKRLDEWMSEKQMLDRFGATDFQSHCNSGRIIWREDPITRGTYEFKDQHNITRETTTYKGKDLTRGHEEPLDNDIDKMFEELYQQDFFSTEFDVFFSFTYTPSILKFYHI